MSNTIIKHFYKDFEILHMMHNINEEKFNTIKKIMIPFLPKEEFYILYFYFYIYIYFYIYFYISL
jgi:hypothetical protein